MQPPSRRSEEITRIFRLRLGNHPSVTFGDSSPRRGAKGFAENCCGICYKGPGTVKTVPYRAFYCVRPTHKHPVGRGDPTPPENYRSRYKKRVMYFAPQ